MVSYIKLMNRVRKAPKPLHVTEQGLRIFRVERAQLEQRTWNWCYPLVQYIVT